MRAYANNTDLLLSRAIVLTRNQCCRAM